MTNVGEWIGDRFVEHDGLWRAEGVVVELDGYRDHGDRSAFHQDRARKRRIVARTGRRLIQVTDRDLRVGAAELADDVRTLLGIGGVRSWRRVP